MLKLYDSNKNFLKNISNYKDLRIESELANGDKTLSFTYRGSRPISRTKCTSRLRRIGM